MKKTAVIVAGGSGQRMGGGTPKQFLPLQGKPVLWHTLSSFLAAFDDMTLIIVLPEQYLDQAKTITASFPASREIVLTTGGATRFDSVKAGLQLVTEPSVVFVHDAVRCLVTPELIRRCYTQAVRKGSAVPAVSVSDSIRIVTGEETHTAADREHIKIIQTPQTFLSELLVPAFGQSWQPAFTDEATVVEAYGKPVYLIEGEFDNIKITRPVDMLVAEQILGSRK
ncbi:2-C-methyl-D-erythritol 4-phosphate cytidylyltransferase [Sediminibacterium soli]|uniref:2-C-methyl-D-erythritol 4-phosphate cytidylyltransferase n=1 Tax=Sediminibacterium soli TaxID=2698829 RepID=UPI00137B34E6|nr:2-C-methyl-D-erythritol 4-phosphate cytidylyltransferase [Sediminibacterium soli]NCI45627.1 2-C-methyl-D-erythritol 4-phosphate cytidylyltransferase [Sediminibacterium soli]